MPKKSIALTLLAIMALTRGVNAQSEFENEFGPGAGNTTMTGGDNTANGNSALSYNTSGGFNTANGLNALLFNTEGSYNTADGFGALVENTTGINNTADGVGALFYNQTGSNNVAVGFYAGYTIYGDNNIAIGSFGETADYNTIRIGNPNIQTRAFMTGINGASLPGNPTNAVVIDAYTGQLAAVPLSTLAGATGATGAQGPAGDSGMNGVGFVPGAYLYLPSTTAAPAGFTKIGTKTDLIADMRGRMKVLKMTVYQKN